MENATRSLPASPADFPNTAKSAAASNACLRDCPSAVDAVIENSLIALADEPKRVSILFAVSFKSLAALVAATARPAIGKVIPTVAIWPARVILLPISSVVIPKSANFFCAVSTTVLLASIFADRL